LASNTTSGGRKPTKAERKEEARLERDRIQRQMASRTRNRKIGLGLIALAVAVIVVIVAVSRLNAPNNSPAALLTRASADAKAAGCGPVQQTPNYNNAPGQDPDIDHAHIGDTTDPNAPLTAPPLSSYPTVPPASGPHYPAPRGPIAGGVYTTPPDAWGAIHSLEHGGVIIWYSPAAAGSSQVKQIESFYNQSKDVGQSKVIVAEYNYPDQGAAGQLPAGKQMALVAWHRLQLCSLPSLPAAFDFASQYSSGYPTSGVPSRKYIGVAREPNVAM
jgi:hypothetical protein